MRKCKVKMNMGKTIVEGYFHGWGSNYEEFSDEIGNYSVAIVELSDGQIIIPPAGNVQFVEPIQDCREMKTVTLHRGHYEFWQWEEICDNFEVDPNGEFICVDVDLNSIRQGI